MSIESQRIELTGASGETLSALLDRPSGSPRAFALFAHCFTCSKDLKAVRGIGRTLAEEGIALLRFDFTGLGQSEGDFADTNFSSNLDDLVAAADFLRREHQAPQLLIGHSLGGAAVLAAASRVPEALAVATLGAPSDPSHLRATLEDSVPELEEGRAVTLTLAGRSFEVKPQLLEDLSSHRLESAVRNLDRPLLIFHSPADDTVPLEHARILYEMARHPKSFISLDRADHLLLKDPRDATFVASMLAQWFSRLLPEATTLHARHTVRAGAAGEVIAEIGATGFATRLESGQHVLPADEPIALGGTETGPGPYDYLLGALGACKAMTMRMYANRKGWPLEGARVRLSQDRVHAEDCEDCASTEGMITEISAAIELDGELDAEQRQRIYEIADRCPVHRTLEAEVKVRSRLVEQ